MVNEEHIYIMNDTRENALWSVGYIIIFLAIQLIVMSGSLMVASLISRSIQQELDPMWTVFSMALFSASAICLFTLTRWSPVSRSYILSRPRKVLIWSVVAAIGAVVPSLFIQELIPEWPAYIQRYIDESAAMTMKLMSTPGGYAVLCLLAPVAEELVFRGAVLRTLLAWNPRRRWMMITLSALLFAFAHLNPAQFIHPFFIGLLLGWMYERTRSVLPGIVYHWANNTAAYLLQRAYPSTDITLTDIFGTESRVVMAVCFSLLIIIPAIIQLNLAMKTANTAVLKLIAERLNSSGVTWAVGGSMMLYLRGRATNAHDIDLMVDEKQIESARRVLSDMGRLQPDEDNAQYQTRHYYKYVINGVDIDLIAGFVIVKEGVAHECPLLKKDITERRDLEGTSIPLHSLSVWHDYYMLMGRPEKASMCGD